MIASTHLATGGAVGIALTKFSKNNKLNLFLAFSAGIAFHFFLDSIPHQEYHRGYILILFIIDLILASYLIYRFGFSKVNPFSNYMLSAGVFGSALPDIPDVLVDLVGLNLGWLIYLDRFNNFFHAQHNGFSVGILMQLAIVVVALYAIKSNRDMNNRTSKSRLA